MEICKKHQKLPAETYILHYRNLFKYTYLIRIMESEKVEQFEHKISKGGRFNQVYIPKEMEEIFEVGDIVQVKLLKKKEQLHYSKTLKKLGEFKERLIKEIFSSLKAFSEIKQIFVVGSFLTEKIEYKDIDIIIISSKKQKGIKSCIEEKVYAHLVDRFQLKFHVLAMQEDYFFRLLEICPLTRSMLHYFISNKKFEISQNTMLDKKHISFLLMMPQDLLKISVNSRAFYDSIRRIIAIRRFLENKELDSAMIDLELKSLFNELLYHQLKNNEQIDKKTIEYLRGILKAELSIIKNMLKKL